MKCRDLQTIDPLAQPKRRVHTEGMRFVGFVLGAAKPLDESFCEPDACHLAREKLRMARALERGHAGEYRQPRLPQPRSHDLERGEIEDRRRHEKLRAGLDFVVEPPPFRIEVDGKWIHGRADMKASRGA